MPAKKKTEETQQEQPEIMPAKKEIGTLNIELKIRQDLKHILYDLVAQVRDKAKKAKKMDCRIQIKLIIEKMPRKSIDYQTGQDDFLRMLNLAFRNGVTINTEVK